jgi:hypothetical protein
MLPWFDRVRDAQWRRLDDVNPSLGRFLREQRALYLFGTLDMEAILLSDGRVKVALDDSAGRDDVPVWRDATERERTLSLVIAAERIPELKSLLPQRPDHARDCAVCGGLGYIAPKVACSDCGAMGWQSPTAT